MTQAEQPPTERPLVYHVGQSMRRRPWVWAVGVVALAGIAYGVFQAVDAARRLATDDETTARRRTQQVVNVPPPAPSLPPVPVKFTLRKAALGEGYVVGFINDGERHFKWTVRHQRPTLRKESTFEVRLDPGKSQEFGWQEGHTFYPGDVVVVEHPEFAAVKLVVNPK